MLESIVSRATTTHTLPLKLIKNPFLFCSCDSYSFESKLSCLMSECLSNLLLIATAKRPKLRAPPNSLEKATYHIKVNVTLKPFCFNQQQPLYNNGNEKASSGTQTSSQQTMTNDSAVAKTIFRLGRSDTFACHNCKKDRRYRRQ